MYRLLSEETKNPAGVQGKNKGQIQEMKIKMKYGGEFKDIIQEDDDEYFALEDSDLEGDDILEQINSNQNV